MAGIDRQHDKPFLLTNCWGCFHLTAFLCRRVRPLGPMPNEEIAVENLESLEKYRSYTRYLRQAEEAKNKPAWWKTYRSYVEKADPEHGEKHRRKLLWQFYFVSVHHLNESRLVAGAERVDIGLPYFRPHRTKEVRERKQVMKDNKKNVELERASRLRTCKLARTRQGREYSSFSSMSE